MVWVLGGFHVKSSDFPLKRLKQGFFTFLEKNVVEGGRLLALQNASGLDAVSGKSIGSRAECVAPRIWLRSHRRIVVFTGFIMENQLKIFMMIHMILKIKPQAYPLH